MRSVAASSSSWMADIRALMPVIESLSWASPIPTARLGIKARAHGSLPMESDVWSPLNSV